MKQKLLLLAILITFASWGKSTTANPSIGILLSGYPAGGGQIFFNISIKNTGEETLTNVYVTDASLFGMPIQFSFGPIVSIAPGEEVTSLQAIKYNAYCYDQSQVIVHATTSASIEITDLSADPNAWFNPGVPGSYYNDLPTDIYYVPFDYAVQEGTYNDLNGNSIVDVGDAIIYSYEINFEQSTGGTIYDNNAVVTDPIFFGSFYTTTGIHYLTQAEVDLGYVYNSSGYSGGTCGGGGTFQDQSYCPCPNPGANIITQLTSLLPNRISGKVKYNTNSDNCATGSNFINRRVSTAAAPYNYATYTNSTGDYHILIPNTGNYTTSALTNLGATFSSNPASVAVTSSGSGIDYNNTDFCIGSAAGYTDLNVAMFNVNEAQPGFVATYRIYYNNNGSTSLNGSIQLTYDNGKLSLAGALPAQDSTTANTLTWNYTNLLPFETRYISLSMNVAVPPTVNTNDLLNFTVNATPLVGDNVPANNGLTWNQTVRSSFDPNDKTVIEGDAISLSQASNYLTYVTRFQNTGTANATTVVIKDLLDPKLDWETFQPLASSHASNIQIQNGNAVTYTFPSIDLPYESANEPASHGWMVYRIKPKNDVAVGDIISSDSSIYFDYNLPITTNTATTEITALATTDFIKGNFVVFPNPATNYLVIKAETDMEANYEIFDVNGKLLLNDTVESINPININALQSGFYFLNIKTNQGKATYKFIKN
jgi:uncharacterized repeat protein (TIGR01451 family)